MKINWGYLLLTGLLSTPVISDPPLEVIAGPLSLTHQVAWIQLLESGRLIPSNASFCCRTRHYVNIHKIICLIKLRANFYEDNKLNFDNEKLSPTKPVDAPTLVVVGTNIKY
jgi:hypothetical protein